MVTTTAGGPHELARARSRGWRRRAETPGGGRACGSLVARLGAGPKPARGESTPPRSWSKPAATQNLLALKRFSERPGMSLSPPANTRVPIKLALACSERSRVFRVSRIVDGCDWVAALTANRRARCPQTCALLSDPGLHESSVGLAFRHFIDSLRSGCFVARCRLLPCAIRFVAFRGLPP